MKVVYPYNEILPKKKAHDAFIFHECKALANKHDVTLVCGKGSSPHLFDHYQTDGKEFAIKQLPILRKNFLNISWNLPFFFLTQRYLKKVKPDVVILSVFKQGLYHLKRKLANTLYIYEVHELAYYPNTPFDVKRVNLEKEMLAKADHIVVTTEELKKILSHHPYNLTNPIKVIPLASDAQPLPVKSFSHPLHLGYVGQLYEEQGVLFLLQALVDTKAHLSIVGGKESDIAYLKAQAKALNVEERVNFLGFHPPQKLPSLLHKIDAFVAPFENKGKMPFVAHTKLIEYIHWARPIIAPNLPVVQECFPNSEGVIYFDPQSVISLSEAINSITTLNTSFSPIPWSKRIAIYNKILTSKYTISNVR